MKIELYLSVNYGSVLILVELCCASSFSNKNIFFAHPVVYQRTGLM